MTPGLLLWAACARPPDAQPTTTPPTGPPPTVAERLGEWPFLLPIDAPPTVALVAGGEVPTDVATCGACHPDHRAEWAGSTHAFAMRDAQFLAELAKPGQPRWLCLNCHIPTRPQRAEQIRADTRFAEPGSLARLEVVPEPAFDPARVEEGVSCATCHVRRGEDGLGHVVGPRGSGRAPHRVVADRAALDGVCVRCHSPGPARISATFTCWFETADELAAGPSAGAACVDCHMPTTTRTAAVGGPPLELRRHWWTGGGVPKRPQAAAELVARGYTPGVDVAVDPGPPLRLTLTNTRAGHLVPTADPERHLLVEARVVGADGRVRATHTARLGQTWDWGDEATQRPARRLTDDRIRPGEARTLELPLAPGPGEHVELEVAHVKVAEATVPHLAAAALDAELLALWPEAADHVAAIPETYPRRLVFFRARVEGGDVVVEPFPGG